MSLQDVRTKPSNETSTEKFDAAYTGYLGDEDARKEHKSHGAPEQAPHPQQCVRLDVRRTALLHQHDAARQNVRTRLAGESILCVTLLCARTFTDLFVDEKK